MRMFRSGVALTLALLITALIARTGATQTSTLDGSVMMHQPRSDESKHSFDRYRRLRQRENICDG